MTVRELKNALLAYKGNDEDEVRLCVCSPTGEALHFQARIEHTDPTYRQVSGVPVYTFDLCPCD